MALGRNTTPNVPASAPVQETPAPAPETAPETAPVAPSLFDFSDDVTVPGRGNGSNAMETDKEYLALKEKLAAQRKAHLDGSLSKEKGTAFNSSDVKKHVRYLRHAADVLGIGVAIKTPEGDSNTGRISFRAKDRKNYTKKS